MSHTGVTSLPANVFVSHNLTNLQRLYVTHSDTLGKCPDNIMNFRVIEYTVAYYYEDVGICEAVYEGRPP